jgi:hypothetical protein
MNEPSPAQRPRNVQLWLLLGLLALAAAAVAWLVVAQLARSVFNADAPPATTAALVQRVDAPGMRTL